MDKIKILVCTHKPYPVYSDSVYLPVHAGKAVSSQELGYIGDDSGENISKKNPFYCELTVQYWGWKNLDTEFIGLCHYHRYFKTKFNEQNADALLKNADVILAQPVILPTSIDSFWRSALTPEDVIIFYEVIDACFGEWRKSVVDYMINNNKFYPCNVFVCRKQLFNEFAAWQFDILQKCEKVIKFSPYSRERRIIGFLGESLWPIFCIRNNLKVCTMPLITDYTASSKVINAQSAKEKMKNYILFLITHKNSQNFPRVTGIWGGLVNDGVIKDIGNLK